MQQTHEPKMGDAEKLARNLINCRKWIRVGDARPKQSGWYPVVCCFQYDRERQWSAVGRYSWKHDRWQYQHADLAIEGSGSCVTHWLDVPLPSLPPSVGREGV
jgi:hypothetical protein